MADFSVTASGVIAQSGASTKDVTAGATVTAGQVVYKDTADSKYKLADADVLASAKAEGIALHGASNGQPLRIIVGGSVYLGANVVAGQVYVASTTPGGIAPYGDLATGDYVTVLGVGDGTNLDLSLYVSDVAKA